MASERTPANSNGQEHSHSSLITEFGAFASLLQTWARLYDRFDYWPEACERWAEIAPSSEAFQQAIPLLDKVFLYTNEKEDSVYSNIQRNRRLFANTAAASVRVSEAGRVLSIGRNAKEHLGLSIDQYIQPALVEPIDSLINAAKTRAPFYNLTEIRGKDGVHRLCGVKLLTYPQDQQPELFLTLHNILLPESVENYLRTKLRLTNAEIDVVRRSLRREDLESIARYRGNSLNTIRTHVRKITKKYGCRNFSDVITRTHELIAYHEIYHTFSRDFLPDESPSTRRITSNVAISPVGGQIEYSRYGPEDGRPLVLLHSLEYGFIPPTDFLKSAKDRGYAVYTPLRPGFGKSTRADTIRDCADALSEFTERLRLRDVTVIAFSTSAPAALYLTEVNDRISQTVLVNYALDVRDKLAKVKPSWLRGLMGMALNSKHSFKFALRMTNRMYRRIGCEKFYEHLYKGCEEDLAYLRSGPSDLEYAGDALFSADEESIRLDFLSSFDSDFPIDWKALRKKSIFCVQGQNTHGVSVEPARAAAERFGFPFFVIRNSGRNCIFHRPNEFFGVLDETQKRRMSA